MMMMIVYFTVLIINISVLMFVTYFTDVKITNFAVTVIIFISFLPVFSFFVLPAWGFIELVHSDWADKKFNNPWKQ